MPEIKLYQYPGGSGLASLSPPCLKIQLALGRIGLPFETIDLQTPYDVKKISSTGRVPVIEIDGKRTVESTAVLDALEPFDTAHRLFPKDPQERNTDRLWDYFGTDSLYWCGVYLRWKLPENKERMLAAFFGRKWSIRKAVASRILIPMLHKRLDGQGLGHRTRDEVETAFKKALDTIETGLEGGTFLGNRPAPGRGDLAVATLLAQAGWRETLPDVLAEIRRRPPLVAMVQATFEACGAEKPRGF